MFLRQPAHTNILIWLLQLAAKEKEVEEWGRRFQDMKANHQQLRHKLDSVERYLADLPTAEETQHNTQEISFGHLLPPPPPAQSHPR